MACAPPQPGSFSLRPDVVAGLPPSAQQLQGSRPQGHHTQGRMDHPKQTEEKQCHGHVQQPGKHRGKHERPQRLQSQHGLFTSGEALLAHTLKRTRRYRVSQTMVQGGGQGSKQLGAVPLQQFQQGNQQEHAQRQCHQSCDASADHNPVVHLEHVPRRRQDKHTDAGAGQQQSSTYMPPENS